MTKIYEVTYVSGLDYNYGREYTDTKYFTTKEKAEKFIKNYKEEYPENYRTAKITREIEAE